MIGRKFVVVAVFIALLAVFAGPAGCRPWAQTWPAPQWIIDGSGNTGNGAGFATILNSAGGNDYFGYDFATNGQPQQGYLRLCQSLLRPTCR